MASESSKQEKKEKESKVTKPSLNMAELRELADLVNENGFTDFEFENEKIRVRLSKNLIAPTQPPVAMQQAPIATAPPAQTADATNVASTAQTSGEADAGEESDDGLHKITSPIVGTFYTSPGPDKPAYVSVGDKVSADSVVCIVEAMKLMNEIQAETAGEIVKIYVENAQPVEYGQPLFGIKK